MKGLWARSDRTEKAIFVLVVVSVLYLVAQIIRAVFFL